MMMSTENKKKSIYHKIFLPYTVGLGKIYTVEEIEEAKRSPSFEQEYNLKYLGGVGNFFQLESIEKSITDNYDLIPNREAITYMGVDTGYSDDSRFAVIIVSFFNERINVMHCSQDLRPTIATKIEDIYDLRMKYMVDKILVDGSDPSFIYALKERLGEWPVDYHTVPKENYASMIVEPVPFTKQQFEFLVNDKAVLEDDALRIHKDFPELVIALKSAYVEGTKFIKEKSVNNDLVDALSMTLQRFKRKTVNTIGR